MAAAEDYFVSKALLGAAASERDHLFRLLEAPGKGERARAIGDILEPKLISSAAPQPERV